jgi:hypothetical protein
MDQKHLRDEVVRQYHLIKQERPDLSGADLATASADRIGTGRGAGSGRVTQRRETIQELVDSMEHDDQSP